QQRQLTTRSTCRSGRSRALLPQLPSSPQVRGGKAPARHGPQVNARVRWLWDKRMLFISDSSRRVIFRIFTAMVGCVGLSWGFRLIAYSSHKWIGLIPSAVGAYYLIFLIWTWSSFGDVLVTSSGVTIKQDGTQQDFQWQEVSYCSW